MYSEYDPLRYKKQNPERQKMSLESRFYIIPREPNSILIDSGDNDDLPVDLYESHGGDLHPP